MVNHLDISLTILDVLATYMLHFYSIILLYYYNNTYLFPHHLETQNKKKNSLGQTGYIILYFKKHLKTKRG